MAPLLYLYFMVFVLHSVVACNEDDVRLYNDSSTVKGDGMLQICYSGEWVAVCDYRWSRSHSILACKQLGYNDPNPIAYLDSGYWSTLGFVGTYPCNYQTGSILNCLTNNSYYLNYHYYCNNNRDTISLRCNINTGGCNYKDIRLYNASTNSSGNSGMLQICDSTGHWTAVCDYDWNCYSAHAACSDLGYNDTKPTYSVNGPPWTKIGFGPYSCYSSTSPSLSNCYQYSFYYQHNPNYCSPYKDTVNLVCLEPGTSLSCSVQYEVRLVSENSNSTSEGRIEICYSKKWRTICQSNYYYYYYGSYERIASTLCKQLGFTATPFAKIITDGRYGTGTSDLYMSIPYCSHTYTNIRYCSLYNYGYSQCGNYQCQYNRMGLKCYDPGECNQGDVRLVNGTVAREGRLEICAFGVWGRVCAQHFSKSAAQIACRQANYTDVKGAVIDKYGKYGIGDNPIVFDDLDCFGHEKTLLQCSKTVYPNFTCPDNNIIGLLCLENCSEGDVRLVGGAHKFQGTVEICLDGSWCLVSQHGWDNRDARIVCRELGGYNPSAGEAIFKSKYGKPKRSVRYSNVNCYGNEKRLADCAHHTLEFDAGRTYNTEVAGVDCHVILSSSVSMTTISSSVSIPIISSSTTIPKIFQSVSMTTISSSLSTSRLSIIQSIFKPQFTSKPQCNNENKNGVFISGVLLLVVAFAVLGIAIVLIICTIVRIQRLKNGSYNNRQQMTTLQNSGQLSFQYAKLNTEEGESPPLSEEDEQSDDDMLKI